MEDVIETYVLDKRKKTTLAKDVERSYKSQITFLQRKVDLLMEELARKDRNKLMYQDVNSRLENCRNSAIALCESIERLCKFNCEIDFSKFPAINADVFLKLFVNSVRDHVNLWLYVNGVV